MRILAGFVSLVTLVLFFSTAFGQETPHQSLGHRLLQGYRGMADRDALILMGSGASFAYLASRSEDPVSISLSLDYARLEGGIDLGDAYGDGRTIAVGAGGLLLAGWLGEEALGDMGKDVLASFAVASSYVWALKLGVGRERPSGGPHSFPSGHTAAAFSTVPALFHHGGTWVGLAATALAIGTAAGRMEDQKHYSSDVIFGAAVGFVAGRAVLGKSVPWSRVWRTITLSGTGVGVALKF